MPLYATFYLSLHYIQKRTCSGVSGIQSVNTSLYMVTRCSIHFFRIDNAVEKRAPIFPFKLFKFSSEHICEYVKVIFN